MLNFNYFSFLSVFSRTFGKWVGVYGFLHLLAGGVRVDLCSAEIFVAQNILQNANIYVAVLVHQRRRRVPQLVYGVSRAAKTDFVRYLLTMACTVLGLMRVPRLLMNSAFLSFTSSFGRTRT